jgi:hypothetical protein
MGNLDRSTPLKHRGLLNRLIIIGSSLSVPSILAHSVRGTEGLWMANQGEKSNFGFYKSPIMRCTIRIKAY